MRRIVFVAVLLAAIMAASQAEAQCAKIKDGVIVDSAGVPLAQGYDQFGYNYQGGIFNGKYDGLDRKLDGKYYGQVGDFVDDRVVMKWSPEWMSNMDCNGDGKLDRGYDAKTGLVSGVSKGWETNQIEGEYLDAEGEAHHYEYFAKIVFDGGAACSVPGNPTCLWGKYVLLFEVFNDPYGGFHGANRAIMLHPPGFGQYQ